MFEPAAGGVAFRAATGLDATAVTQVQAGVRRRLLRSFVRRGLLPTDDAQAMAQWQHGGGFSVDASVRIAATDRAGRERLLRYCARPPFALDRLHELDPERLLYESAKQSPGGTGPQILTPLQLLDRLAVLVPPPRVHRHRHLLVRPCDRLLGVFATTSTVWMWPVVRLRDPARELTFAASALPVNLRLGRTGSISATGHHLTLADADWAAASAGLPPVTFAR